MHIVAMGGGGFSGRKRDDALARYVLDLTRARRPRVCFIPTASGDSAAYVRRFERTAQRLRVTTSVLSVFALPTGDLAKFLCAHDAVFVGGGNTRNMLALWRLWGLDDALRAAYRRGVVLSGSSAGAICWFSAGLTDSFPGRYQELRCLGWLHGSYTPHFDGEPRRQAVYRRLIRSGVIPGGFAVDDGVALHFDHGALVGAISARGRAGALHIRRRGSLLLESQVPIQRVN